MGFFRRGSKKKGKGGGDSSDSTPADSVDDEPQSTGHETAPPQRVGVVSGVLSTNVDGQETLFGDVVSKRFGPQNENDDRELPPQRLTGSEFGDDEAEAPSRVDTTQSTGRDRLRALASLFPDDPAMLELEVDPMAHIGRATPRTKGRGLGAHSVALNRLGPAARRRRSRRRCGSSRRYESGLPAKRGRR